MLKTVTETAALLDRSERKHSFVIAFFMLGSAFLEVVGVGLIFPLVQVLVDPSTIFRSRWLEIAYRFSGVNGPRRFLVVCAVGFLIVDNLSGMALSSHFGPARQTVDCALSKRALGCSAASQFGRHDQRR
jgi:hypothetical protein